MIKKIGVLTSGGDAPGMNAAIRGVVRAVHKMLAWLTFLQRITKAQHNRVQPSRDPGE